MFLDSYQASLVVAWPVARSLSLTAFLSLRCFITRSQFRTLDGSPFHRSHSPTQPHGRWLAALDSCSVARCCWWLAASQLPIGSSHSGAYFYILPQSSKILGTTLVVSQPRINTRRRWSKKKMVISFSSKEKKLNRTRRRKKNKDGWLFAHMREDLSFLFFFLIFNPFLIECSTKSIIKKVIEN